VGVARLKEGLSGRVGRLPTTTITFISLENGERPQFIRTRAIDVSFDGKEGDKAGHVSDMRSVGGGKGWKRSPRDAESI
jgi:hypothetical protein